MAHPYRALRVIFIQSPMAHALISEQNGRTAAARAASAARHDLYKVIFARPVFYIADNIPDIGYTVDDTRL